MSAYNPSRRRPEGWAERRKYYRRLTESDRPQMARPARPETVEASRRS